MTQPAGRRDPLLEAGIRYCGTCGATAYPEDAAWIAGDLILASFPPLCDHADHAMTGIVTPSVLDDSPLPRCRICGDSAGREVDLCPDCRCRADTWTGARCVNRAKGDGLCGVHLAKLRRQRQHNPESAR